MKPIACVIGGKLMKYSNDSLPDECLLYPEREWVGLTKEEVEDIEITWEATSEWSTFGHAVRYIETKLKEKNA